MKGLKEVIAGIGFLISGVLGVAIGNLEEILFYSASANAGTYKHAFTYYLFMFFIINGFIYLTIGFFKKND